MKKFHLLRSVQFNWKKYIFILGLPGLCLGSLAFKNSSPKTKQRFSGRELYAGIIFGKGQIITQISGLRDAATEYNFFYNKTNSPKYDKMQSDLLNSIGEAFPEYYNKLENDIYSKNPLIIKRRVTEAYEMVSKITFIKNLNLIIKASENDAHLTSNVSELKRLLNDFKNGIVDQDYVLNELKTTLNWNNRNSLLMNLTKNSKDKMSYFESQDPAVAVVINNVVIYINSTFLYSMQYTLLVMRRSDNKNDLAFEKLAYSLATEL